MRPYRTSRARTRPVLEDVDRAILKELARNSRISMAELGKRVHLSRAHVYRRVEALRNGGVIRGFSLDVDASAAGAAVAAVVLFEAKQQSWDELHDLVRRMPQVQYAAATSGECDLALIVRAESLSGLRDIVLGSSRYWTPCSGRER